MLLQEKALPGVSPVLVLGAQGGARSPPGKNSPVPFLEPVVLNAGAVQVKKHVRILAEP